MPRLVGLGHGLTLVPTVTIPGVENRPAGAATGAGLRLSTTDSSSEDPEEADS